MSTGKGKGFWARTGERPTSDLIVLAMTVVVCLVTFATVAALLIVKIRDPDANVAELAKQVAGFMSSLFAVIVGYVAGRGVNDPPPADPPTEGTP
jgi:hypothetical protein